MTLRALLLGLLGAALICGLTYFNDAVMHQTYLVGNNMPIAVYGSLIVFVAVINPLLYFVWKRLALTGPELAVILALSLAAAVIPGSGLMRTFTTSLVIPFQMERVNPGWQKPQTEVYWRHTGVVEQVPPQMLPAVTAANENTVLTGFIQGLGVGNKNIAWSQVPWSAWAGTMRFWLPLLLIFWIALLGLSLVVHRQWADHEQLPYPIAQFAHSLLPNGATGGVIPTLLRNRLFWISTIAIFLFHLNNYLCVWYPNLLPINRQLHFDTQSQLLPLLNTGGIGWWFWAPTFVFTVVAVGYLLATDVSLSLAVGPVLWGIVNGILVGYGISSGGGFAMDFTITSTLAFGAYTGFLLVMLYTGRHYYFNVLKRAFFLPTSERLLPESIWGARLFLVASIALTFYISISTHLEWQLTVCFLCLAVMIFLVMSRIMAETGAFFIQNNFYPMAFFIGLLGAGAVGPQALLIILMLTVVMLVDPREAFMPFITNSFKVLDANKVPVSKITVWVIVSLIVGLAVAVPTTLYLQYRNGANMQDGWATSVVPMMPFNGVVTIEQRLQAQDMLKSATQVTGWAHFTHLQPNPNFGYAFLAGALLVILFTIGRLRFSKWPLHPVLFLIWTSYPGACFAFSFFVGWAIKSLVTRFGGGATYRLVMPLMLGLIAGDMIGGLASMVIGAIYFSITHQPPKGFNIMPG